MPFPCTLSDALDGADFASLSLVRLAPGDGWQANLNKDGGNSFRVRVGSTPSEALLELFAPLPCDVPPPPPPPPY